MQSSRAAVFALAGCACLGAPAARAIFGIGEADVHVRAVDAASGQPVANAVVLGSERLEWHAFHSTRSTCSRVAAAALGPRGEADLRPAGPDPPAPLGGAHHYQLLAYRAGYCAGTLQGGTRLQGGELRMTPSSDPAEARLRYLALIARQAAAACPEMGAAWIDSFRAAVLDEASHAASTPLERFLAIRVDEAFDPLQGRHKSRRAVLHGSAIQGNVPAMQQMLDWGKVDPAFSKSYCPPGGNICMMPMPDPNLVPREEPFGIDERDENGFSALMAAAKAMKPEAVRWLLDNGADVNVVSGPGGFSALDLVLSRARDDVQENGPEGFESHLLRMIALLASGRAKPTLHPGYREELADASTWTVGPRLRKFWSDVREQVMGYEARARLDLACSIVQPARASLELRGRAPR